MRSPIFLSATELDQNATAAGLDPATRAALLALAERISATAAHQQCAEALHAEVYQAQSIPIHPSPAALFGDEVHKLYLLIAVDAIRQLRAVHQERGIPETITRESYGAISMCAQRFAEAHNGAIGVEDWVLRSWIGGTVASGNLYRLGRLEFILEPFQGDIRLYRHKLSGEQQALAEAGVRFTAEGYRPFTYQESTYTHYGWPPVAETADGWVATIDEDEHYFTGTPISPHGYALPTPQRLAKADWEPILRNGDTVLSMHIPNFMPLRLDLLRASLQRALDFFPRYHPETPFNAFVCSSWIFNTQWRDMLPPSSNLLAFQRQGYLYPLPSSGAGAIYFLFGKRLIDLATAPQDTTLRRAVIAHMQTGGQLRSGGFLLLPADLPQFGQAPSTISTG